MNPQWHLARRMVLTCAFALIFVQFHCLLVPDDDEKGEPVANRPPTVRILSGAPTDDSGSSSYRIRFRWSGLDDDGVVTGYQWAIDDTLTDDAWSDTADLSGEFLFEATTHDQDDPDSGIFTDWHTFSIRAIDNEAAVSRPDMQAFNARTLAPTSEITFPPLTSGSPEFNSTVVFVWDGEDLDSTAPSRKPVAWDYKLVRIRQVFDSDEVIRDSLSLGDNMLLDSLHVGSKTDWIRVPFEQSRLKLQGLPRGEYLAFAVRAVDEAGAVEPFLKRGRNTALFGVRRQPGTPVVTMSAPGAGTHRFWNGGPAWEINVPSNQDLRFHWFGDASHYGSWPGRSNYALDIPDPDDDTLEDSHGIGGWIGWKDRNELDFPIRFPPEVGNTEHVFWVRMRDQTDEKESETLCQVVITVIPFTFEDFALIVDDAKFAIRPPNDGEHDAFLRETITHRFYELGDVDHLAFYPPRGNNDERSTPIRVGLETFAHYQHVFWSVQLGAGNPQPLRSLEGDNQVLSTYAAAGGRLFFGGGRISSFMLGGPNGTFGYPKIPPSAGGTNPDFDEDSFIWKFMKYRNEIVSVPTRGASAPQVQASGLIALRSQHPAYPDLHLDYEKRDPFRIVKGNAFFGGIKDWEGAREITQAGEQIPGFDALYTAVTMDTTLCCGPRSANLEDAVVAHRFESTSRDTLIGNQQGRMVVFNFQPYWFEEGSLLEAGTAAIDWLVTGRDR